MNALFNFLSSPLKQPAERPPPPTMPLTASKSKTYSPRERQRLNQRAMDRYTEPEGRSPVRILAPVYKRTAVLSLPCLCMPPADPVLITIAL
jgi:hypothetical protein